ncbi:MAG: DegT/DnrJ/EryC1/StrS family aminotransferase [Chloroflexota bacterium]
MKWQIPLSDLNLGTEERLALMGVLDSGWLTMGRETAGFEEEFRAHARVPHAIAVANGTAALHLSLKAFDIGPGDEVICPSLNFCAGPNVIVAVGAKVIFADVTSLDDLCLSPLDVAARITPRTKAIMAMHYAGYPCDMAHLNDIARHHGLHLIEDAAHALGAELAGTRCGALADAGCFSFYSNKNMTTGEGGMITTSRPEFAQRLRLLRSHGMTVPTLDRHKGHAFSYNVIEPGFNYRMDELRAALGRVQLKRLDAGNASRRELAQRYRDNLAGEFVTFPFSSPRGQSAHHIQPVLLPPGTDRGDFMAFLKNRGIQTSIHYPPTHLFDWYRGRYPGVSLPVTEEAFPRLVTLPLFASMRQEQVDRVCEAVHDYFSSQTRRTA